MKFPRIAALLHHILTERAHLPSAGHLHNLDGSLYMGRWWIVAPDTASSKFLRFISRGRYETIRLHHINRGDEDRELHSHPFDYSTFILKGFYYEEKLEGGRYVPGVPSSISTTSRRMEAGMIGHMDSSFHRVAAVAEGGVWTMFWMGPNNGKWGFLMPDGRYLDRRAYFRHKGYTKGHVEDKPKDFQP